jgi:Fe-S cluster assembly protein SufD
MSPVAEETGLDRAAFERFVSTRPASEPAWLAELRQDAWKRFEAGGLPTTRDEDWRSTSLAPLTRTAFRRNERAVPRVEAGELAFLTFGHAFDGHLIVLVDGRYAPELSSLGGEPGVTIGSLKEALAADPAGVQDLLAATRGPAENAFGRLNAAFLEDGAVIRLADGVVVGDPVHVVHFASGGAVPTLSHPRTLIQCGRQSRVTLVESYGGRDGAVYLTNAVTEAVLGEGAVFDHYKVQREGSEAIHMSTLSVTQGRDSRFCSLSIALGGALVRNDVRQVFAGPGGHCVLNGLFMASGRQHTDTHTWVDHAQPHCTTRELYKGILDGASHGVFVGKVLVRQGANGTDAQQTNKNLLLSREALVDSVPQLEILADDVKCKHGSTTGQLDPEALFYLRSRGIGQEAAKSLLTYAFASDLVGRVQVAPIRRGLEEYLQERLPAVAEVREAVV